MRACQELEKFPRKIQSVEEVPDVDLNQIVGADGVEMSKYHAMPVAL